MIFVTTSHDADKYRIERAKDLANELGIPYLARRKNPNLLKHLEDDYCYVVEKDRLVVRWNKGCLFFHPSTAKVRMRNIKNGLKDHLIECLSPTGSEVVLDATMGLGSEAILMSAFLPNGKVVGLEASKPIYVVVREGLTYYRAKEDWINEAMKRIEVINADFRNFIHNLPDDSFDVVYCDPMFENPVFESSSMNPLRIFAKYDTVTQKDVDEMIRVAKKKVILKAHLEDTLFSRIHVDRISGSRKSKVLYGVIEKK